MKRLASGRPEPSSSGWCVLIDICERAEDGGYYFSDVLGDENSFWPCLFFYFVACVACRAKKAQKQAELREKAAKTEAEAAAKAKAEAEAKAKAEAEAKVSVPL